MTRSHRQSFRVALTADYYEADGSPKYGDIGLSVFDEHPGIEPYPLGEYRPQIGADQVRGAQGVLVGTPSVTAETVSEADDLLAIGRCGVGYDAVDVAACTEAGVVLFITKGAVDRSVAEATVGWMIALTHHMRIKDRLVRTGQWEERSGYMGGELRDRTFGAIGLGGIARETLRLLGIFGMKGPLAFDPYVDGTAAEGLGVKLVDLDELLARADFVSVHCPLTDETRGLIGGRELALMRPEAYLINTARGGIVDEEALYDALKSRRIAGAAIDCFATEPVTSPHRFGELDNVLLAPHSIAWTDELFRDIGRAACGAMVDLSLGRVPWGVVNSEVFDRSSFREKWNRLRIG